MLLMDELDYLRLYPAKRKVHIPVNLENKRKGAAIMLLSQNSVDSHTLMNMPYIYNLGLYRSLYIDRNVNAMIDSGAIIDEDPINEAMQHVKGPGIINRDFVCITGNKNDEILMRSVYSENRFLKWYRYFKAKEKDIPDHVKIIGYQDLKNLINDFIGANLRDKRSGITMNSYSSPTEIAIVCNSGYGPLKASEGPNWEKYAENELITYVIMNSCKNCSRYLAGQVAAVLSGQFGAAQAKKCEDFGEIDDEGLATCYVIYQLYKEEGQRGIIRLCKSGDPSILAAYASKRFIDRMKTNLGINENTGQYPYNVLAITEDIERMRTMNKSGMNKNFTSKSKEADTERYNSLTSKNTIESIAKVNPELFNRAKLFQIQASKNLVEDFNKFIDDILAAEFKVIDDTKKDIADKFHGRRDRFNQFQSRCNIYMDILKDCYENLRKQGKSDSEISRMIKQTYIPELLTEDGCKQLITIRINENRILTTALNNMLEENYMALGLSEEEAKALIADLNTDSTNGQAIKKIQGFLDDPSKLEKFKMGKNSYDFRPIGGGVLLLSADEDIKFADAPSKHLVNIFSYDAVVSGHGSENRHRIDKQDIVHAANDEYKKAAKSIDAMKKSADGMLSIVNQPDVDIEERHITNLTNFLNKAKSMKLPSIKSESSILEVQWKGFSDDEDEEESIFAEIDDTNDKFITRVHKRLPDKYFDQFDDLADSFKSARDQYIKYYNHAIESKNKLKMYGKNANKSTWEVQPIDTLQASGITDVPTLLRQLKKEGFKNVLLMSCNPGSVQLPDDIKNDKDFHVKAGMFSVYKESVDDMDEVEKSIYILEQELDEELRSIGVDPLLESSVNQLMLEYEALDRMYVLNENNGVLHEGLVDALKAIVHKAIEIVVAVWKKILQFLKWIWKKVKEFFVGKPTENSVNTETKEKFEVTVITMNGGKATTEKKQFSTMAEAQAFVQKANESISKDINGRSKTKLSEIKKIEKAINSGKVKPNEKKQDSNNESTIIEMTADDIPNGRRILNKFKHEDLNKNTLNKYRDQYRNLDHIRTGENNTGRIYTDNGRLVAIISIENKENNQIWIQGIEIFGDYKSKRLSYALLDIAVKEYQAKYLSVRKTNIQALYIYKEYGFRIYKDTDSMYFMSLNSIKESASFVSDSADLALKVEILDLVDSLSDKEREDIALNGVYNTEDPSISKTIVKRNYDGEIIGFLDLHYFNNTPGAAFITIAVSPKYRGNGIGKQMVEELIHSEPPIPNLNRYIWHVDPENGASVNLAKSCGFTRNNIKRHRNDLNIDEDTYEYIIPFREAAEEFDYCWYHLVPKGTNMSAGIISLRYMLDHGMTKEFKEASDKYRERMCNPNKWGYYDKNPEDLTDEEIIEGLIRYRGEYGDRSIYLFRFPPYKSLGKNMKKILDGKDLYKVDISAIPKSEILEIDYGHEGSHSDNPALSKDYYDTINGKDYFANYDDNNPMAFSTINHISIATKSGKIDRRYIEKVEMPIIPITEQRIPLPYRYIAESSADNAYICNEDYITDGHSITFFNGMNTDVLTEAEKKYDTRLKKYLFAERLKNNKMVALRYEEMKAMNPWITKTYLKLPMYKQLNLFIDLSYYHGLFLHNLNYKRDMALNMYWDFLNRLINDSEYKDQYKKITIFLPVWPSAWGVETVEDLIGYTKSINPISLIFRYLKKNPDALKKWGNKDILFMGNNGYFKVNFSTIALRDMSKFKRLITKVFNNTDITEEDTDDGYGPRKDDISSPAAITASLIDKIEKNSNIKIDNITGDNYENQWRDESLDPLKPTGSQFTHLRIRTGSFSLPNPGANSKAFKKPDTGIKNRDEEPETNARNAVIFITPSEDESIDAFLKSNISKTVLSRRGFYKP